MRAHALAHTLLVQTLQSHAAIPHTRPSMAPAAVHTDLMRVRTRPRPSAESCTACVCDAKPSLRGHSGAAAQAKRAGSARCHAGHSRARACWRWRIRCRLQCSGAVGATTALQGMARISARISALVDLQFSAPHCTTTACESESGMLDPACALLEAASPAPPSSRANAKPHLVCATFGKRTRRVRADSWRADPERFGLLFHRLALEDRRSITSAAAQSNGRFRCAACGPRAGGRATADKDGSRKRHS